MLHTVDKDGFKALRPEELKLIHKIYVEICRQAWFDRAEKPKLANHIVAMYQRGLVDPENLEQLCTAAARKHFARRGIDDRFIANGPRPAFG